MLAAALASVGADIDMQQPVVADDESGTIGRRSNAPLAADVPVTSGGVSVGPHDLVRAISWNRCRRGVLARCDQAGQAGVVRVRAETLVFGLPGNPVSSLVGSSCSSARAARAARATRAPAARRVGLAGGAAAESNDARDEFVRARSRLDRNGVVLEPLSGQESHMIARAAAADALVHRAPRRWGARCGLARRVDPSGLARRAGGFDRVPAPPPRGSTETSLA